MPGDGLIAPRRFRGLEEELRRGMDEFGVVEAGPEAQEGFAALLVRLHDLAEDALAEGRGRLPVHVRAVHDGHVGGHHGVDDLAVRLPRQPGAARCVDVEHVVIAGDLGPVALTVPAVHQTVLDLEPALGHKAGHHRRQRLELLGALREPSLEPLPRPVVEVPAFGPDRLEVPDQTAVFGLRSQQYVQVVDGLRLDVLGLRQLPLIEPFGGGGVRRPDVDDEIARPRQIPEPVEVLLRHPVLRTGQGRGHRPRGPGCHVRVRRRVRGGRCLVRGLMRRGVRRARRARPASGSVGHRGTGDVLVGGRSGGLTDHVQQGRQIRSVEVGLHTVGHRQELVLGLVQEEGVFGLVGGRCPPLEVRSEDLVQRDLLRGDPERSQRVVLGVVLVLVRCQQAVRVRGPAPQIDLGVEVRRAPTVRVVDDGSLVQAQESDDASLRVHVRHLHPVEDLVGEDVLGHDAPHVFRGEAHHRHRVVVARDVGLVVLHLHAVQASHVEAVVMPCRMEMAHQHLEALRRAGVGACRLADGPLGEPVAVAAVLLQPGVEPRRHTVRATQ